MEALVAKAINNYIDSASSVIDYKVIDDRVGASGFNADGSLNKNYLMEEAEFKTFFKEKLLQVVSQHESNKPFHDCIDNMSLLTLLPCKPLGIFWV